jgi:hypothetical protein
MVSTRRDDRPRADADHCRAIANPSHSHGSGQPYLPTLPSPSFFLAKAACLSVSAPALTIRSIFLDIDMSFNDSFASLIFWLEDGRASL